MTHASERKARPVGRGLVRGGAHHDRRERQGHGLVNPWSSFYSDLAKNIWSGGYVATVCIV